MNRQAICPNCREALMVPIEFFERPVRCANCSSIFTPAEVSAEPPSPAGRSRNQADIATENPRLGRENEAYELRDADDDLPTRRAGQARPTARQGRRSGADYPARRPGRSPLFWLVLVFGGLFTCCGLSCGGLFLFGLYLDNPKLTPYSPTDKGFRAGFPGAVITASTSDELGQPKATYEHSRKLLQDTFFIHTIDLKRKPLGDDAEDQLESYADRILNQRAGTDEIERTPTTVQGYPALELHLEHPDDTTTFIRVILVEKRIYYVGVTGRGLVPESQRVALFWEEFRIENEGKIGADAAGDGGNRAVPKAAGKGAPKVAEPLKKQAAPVPPDDTDL